MKADEVDLERAVTPAIAVRIAQLGGPPRARGAFGKTLFWLFSPILFPLKWLSLLLIRFYKLCISPLLPPACRYHPTCSTYTFEAIQRYGFIKGCALGCFRISRCQPFCRSGYDPVPDPFGLAVDEPKPESAIPPP